MKKIPTIKRDIKLNFDYGEYLTNGNFQYSYLFTIGNKVLEGMFKTHVKPTKKQLRKIKQSWFKVVRSWDYKTPIIFKQEEKVFSIYTKEG